LVSTCGLSLSEVSALAADSMRQCDSKFSGMMFVLWVF
jgi:hypothetical protein